MWRLSEAFEQRSLPQSWHEKSFLGEFPANWWIGGLDFGMVLGIGIFCAQIVWVLRVPTQRETRIRILGDSARETLTLFLG